MGGDAAANAVITWLSRDSFVPILFRRSKPLHEKMTGAGVVCGIADVLVATLATTSAPLKASKWEGASPFMDLI